MPTVVKIKLDGFGHLERALKTIGPRAARRVGAKAMRVAAQVIVDMAKVLAPVRTGALEESITSAPQRSNVQRELKIQIGFKPPVSARAHFTEYGTRHSAAHPFMRPALDARGRAAIAVMGHELWKGIAAEAAKAPKGKK